jgi:Bifunctional DNA primase/polymerase, N-terminal/Primase C terminal 1 (PriCT-1)
MRQPSRKAKNRRLRNALRYASRRWPILPLFGIVHHECECGDANCRRPGKHPRTKHGLKDATTDRKQIKKWWQAHPSSNVGIVTGSPVGPMVIDVDGALGKREWRRLKKRLDLPDVSTLTAVTGNGTHYYFTSASGISNSSGLLGKGIDVRGVGGYVVGVGSRHVNGTHYQWENPSQPIKPLPQQLLLELGIPRSDLAAVEKSDGIVRGERNTTLTSFAGVMRRPGMSYRAIKAALLAENRNRCNPPLREEEVKIIASSVAKYAPVSPLGDWPEPLGDSALHGIFREIVTTFTSRSEVDPVGVLIHALTFAGSAMGSSAHIRVASDRHHVNIFTVTVGDTAKARKMSAFNHINQLFRIAVPAWVQDCIETGLSSGEGLIRSIRECENRFRPDIARLRAGVRFCPTRYTTPRQHAVASFATSMGRFSFGCFDSQGSVESAGQPRLANRAHHPIGAEGFVFVARYFRWTRKQDSLGMCSPSRSTFRTAWHLRRFIAGPGSEDQVGNPQS